MNDPQISILSPLSWSLMPGYMAYAPTQQFMKINDKDSWDNLLGPDTTMWAGINSWHRPTYEHMCFVQ